METLPITELEAAINRARAVQPSTGAESALARDVSVLGGLYGRLIWQRRDAVRPDELTGEERAALRRWCSPGG